MHGTLENLRGEISPWLQEIVTIATSWWALRVYAVIVAILIVVISFWIAQRQRTWLMKLTPGNFDRTFRGPKPTRKETIEKQLNELRVFKQSMMLSALGSVGWLKMFGLLVPSLLVVVGTLYFSWFDPAGHILVDDKLRPLGSPGVAQTFWFIVSQLSLGVAGSPASFASAFGMRVPNVTFDQVNPVSDIVVLTYRYFVGVFGGVFGHFLWTLARVANSTGRKEAELLEALENFSSTNHA